jgi:hypothetical protein
VTSRPAAAEHLRDLAELRRVRDRGGRLVATVTDPDGKSRRGGGP